MLQSENLRLKRLLRRELFFPLIPHILIVLRSCAFLEVRANVPGLRYRGFVMVILTRHFKARRRKTKNKKQENPPEHTGVICVFPVSSM